jgi:thioredoxin reductase (NADPH)
MKTVIFEKLSAGGQMTLTYEIENYPGYKKIGGTELADKMREHAIAQGAEFKLGSVSKLAVNDGIWSVYTRRGEERAAAVILASGASRKKLDVPGEAELAGFGVSYCASCDGGFYKGADVAVVGGGNTAFEDALYLAGICRKVYIVHRREGFRAEKRLVDAAASNQRIEILTNRVVKKITGEGAVGSVILESAAGENELALGVKGVFVAIGTMPQSGLAEGFARIDENGYVLSDETCKTNVPGLYAAGDLRKKPVYQITTAVGDGAVAATEAVRYINGLKENRG